VVLLGDHLLGVFNMNTNKSLILGGDSIWSGVGVVAFGSGILISYNNKNYFNLLTNFGSNKSSSLDSVAKPQKIDSNIWWF